MRTMKLLRIGSIWNRALLGWLLLGSPLASILQARDPTTYSFYSWDRQRTYTITTQEFYSSLLLPQHWLYQPSVILAAPETNNLRTLIFTSNLYDGSNSDQAIWVTSDVYGTLQFPAPTTVLTMSQSSNVCDMAGARPLWDGSLWHVYIQALVRDFSGACTGPGVVVQAIGPTLYNLAWDVIPGTQQANIVLQGSGAGIGEDQQWFYIPSANPFVTTYNDWGNPIGPGRLLSAYSNDSRNMTPWYSAAQAYADLSGQGYTNANIYPDAMFGGSLDEGTYGPFALGLESSCAVSGSDAMKYQYSRVLGYFPSPLQSNPLDGSINGEAVHSISYDSHGERMFRPRFVRDSHGYVPLSSATDTSRTWSTFVFYNPTQINNDSSDGCDLYSRWTSNDQQFAFSQITITEQASIYLDPNPIAAANNSTTVYWNLPGFTTIDIYVQSPGSAPALFAEADHPEALQPGIG